ncbi:MAG TPA: type II toxin-antitoxin system RelE/ParE family toxin [Tepidisphaeraceae bacterium]|jgi:toxin ParE1/3/4|nr:type II toxin-antitoxin system RelE/ParE family toxin [Tepidisphaeraceae bacterium]
MSFPRIRIREQADEEIDDIAQYIAARNLEAGRRFYDAIQSDLEKLAAMPGMGAARIVKNPALQGLRSWPLSGYRNYLIFYLPLIDGGIEVIHVLHGARNLGPTLERG